MSVTLAALGDIHANHIALEACLDAAEAAGTAEAGDAQADAAEAAEAVAEEATVQGAEEASHRRRNK